PLTNVYWQGSGTRKLTQAQQDILEKIGAIVGKQFLADADFLPVIAMAEKKQNKLLLASDLTFEQLSQLQEQFPSHENLIINTHFKRFYPYGTFASHILGYLGIINLDIEGKMGLEKMFEESLKGEQGVALRKITSTGKSLDRTQLKEGIAGQNIETTIDIDIQDICETIFPPDQAGSCIIMDPQDGALLAVVSRPNFDPNIFLNPIDPAMWQTLQEKQPFLNRAFGAAYPPGSIFKLVSMSAALEHGIIQAESTCFCRGYATFCERNYFCSRRTGHGTLTMHQALAQSCNIPFFEKIGRQLSIDTLAQYAHKFGLGEKTNICFPEKEGLIPTSAWKKRVKGERWWPGETLSASIGQSFLLVTPIQVACMISSIFTGYLSTPRILQQEPITKRPLEIAQKTLDFLRQSMKSVVTMGTGMRISQVKNIEMYAKTSTAQVSDYSKREFGLVHREHGWFVGYFRYKDSKPLTMVIMAENVSSSREATKYAKNFLVEYKKLIDERLSA
ncbi:MAG: penicillin-binding transpeptidase domain-containing protein, partial [Candidatus Babeliales bacterium]|nr:penicillin-binding transpeptidase domain-containing protein [Candidatus Babeliales bacterium]